MNIVICKDATPPIADLPLVIFHLMLVFILPLRKGLATPSCLPRPYSRVYSRSRVFACQRM